MVNAHVLQELDAKVRSHEAADRLAIILGPFG